MPGTPEILHCHLFKSYVRLVEYMIKNIDKYIKGYIQTSGRNT